MRDLEIAMNVLLEGGYTCVLCRDGECVTSAARGVRPLVDWLDSGRNFRNFCAADKVVGRATAFLYVLLGVRAVHARVMSTSAREVLEENGIAAFLEQETHGIINRRGDGPCPFETLVMNVNLPEEALSLIRKKQFQMRQPGAIAGYTAGRDFCLDRTGCSGSTVAIFDDFVVKCEPVSEESENHLAMLRWLDGKVDCPRVLETVLENGFRWVVMTKISGEMACAGAWREDPHRLVRVLADAMKKLWTVDIADCPVDQSTDSKLARASGIIDRGEVDMELAEPETFGEKGFPSPAALLRWLQEHRPKPEPVLSHGDYCLPNVFLKDWQLSGFLDLGRSGAGDRWNDIALCWRSLRDNFGGHYGADVAGFHPDELFDALGIEKNEEKLRYYLLMDELF